MNLRYNSSANDDDDLKDLVMKIDRPGEPALIERDQEVASSTGEIKTAPESMIADVDQDADPSADHAEEDDFHSGWQSSDAETIGRQQLESAGHQTDVQTLTENKLVPEAPSVEGAEAAALQAPLAEPADPAAPASSVVVSTAVTSSASGLPEGFSLRDDGVYVVEGPDGADGEIEEKFLCSPLRVIDRLRTRMGTGWGRRIAVTNPEGREITVTVLDEELEARGRGFLATLTDVGLRIGRLKRAREIVLDLLRSWNPDKFMMSTNRQGWADDACEAFVLGEGRIVGDPDVVLASSDVSKLANAVCSSRALQDWKQSVAGLCVGNSLMTTAVSLAFVGPPLELLGRDGGGLHLRGASSRGKTTLLRAAASVWGSPKLVQSWRTTTNALESTAAAANSMLLVLDEIGEATGQDLDQAAYMLANGKAKARLNSSGRSSPTRQWKLALLSSGEVSVADKMAQAGRRTQAGQEVRLIDVVADAQLHGAFDDLHGCTDGAAFARLAAERSSFAYGTAGPAFVAWLLQDKQGRLRQVLKVTAEFQALVEQEYAPQWDGVTRRTMDWFALVAAAGHLATAAGCTDWPEDCAIASAVDVFGAWLDTRTPDVRPALTNAVGRVRSYLAAHGGTFLPMAKTGSTGASKVGWQDENYFYIPSATWQLIHDGIDMKSAARELHAAGFLIPADHENWMRKAPTSIPGRPRTYVVKKLILATTSPDLQAA